MRELPDPKELNKERDAAGIIVLPPEGWYCLYCPTELDEYLGTVEWIDGPDGLPFGRCRLCGQKYVLLEL